MKRRTFVTLLGGLTIFVVVVTLALMSILFKQDILLATFVTIAFSVILLIIYFSLDTMRNESNKQIEKNFDMSYKEALNHGDVGILMYDENYEITFMSDFFNRHNIDHVGEKVLNYFPELQDMLNNEGNNKIITINDEKFSVRKIEKAFVLTFKNITTEYDLDKKLDDDACVLGLLSYDNYDESSISEDDLSYINSNIKVPVLDYFKNYGVVYNTLKNNRMLLIMSETTFKQIRNDRFSILNKVREVAKDGNVSVTLSMAFSRGSDNYEELDKNVEELMDLAQTRGGDQVVVRKVGEDATFYGGTTEAREKQSKTKVRVMANTIRDLIEKSSNVIIVGHKDMDADCVGSALCMSNIALALNKNTYVVAKSGGIESMINDVLNKYSKVLENKHTFIYENEALDILNDDSLVIMVDHHSGFQSNGQILLKQAKRIIIVDHHRRKADLDVNAMMMYIEAAASSATELLVEMLPYFGKNISISAEEANIMYIGILIDTDRFRVRTGSRTFDVAKQLRRYGADPMVCDDLSQEPYNNVLERSRIINGGKLYKKDIIVSAIKEGTFKRSIASQASDMMVKIKGIEAAFVICNNEKDEVIVSARSKGKINVQAIMEKMNGGGHMTAAGLQVSDTSVAKIEADLLKILDDYFKDGE